jgi:ribonuclease HI
MKSLITVFTDGASRGNPGKGGWGSIVIADTGDKDTSKVIELGGREDHTTNNRMEMTAALEALRAIRTREFEGDIEIHTDSAYLINGITKWVFGWEKNNWLTKEGQAVLNKDIWQGLAEITRVFKMKREVVWKKVEGHSGLRGNERVDEIATSYADNNFTLLFTGMLSNYEKMLGSDIFHVGETAVPKKKSGSSAKAYSYVSYVDGALYIDKTWAACEKRVKGKKGVRFKKSFSAEDEKAIAADFQK